MDSDPHQQSWHLLLQAFFQSSQYDLISLLVLLLLIAFCLLWSALLSASENAFFSLTDAQKEEIKSIHDRREKSILYFLHHQRKLVAVLMIAGNIANVSVVILSSYVISRWLPEGDHFLVQVAAITFAVLLFGEILPRIYAIRHNIRIVRLTALPLYYLSKSIPMRWVIRLLESSTAILDKKLARKPLNISIDDIHEAIELTGHSKDQEEKELLKGIVNFGNLSVRQVMRPRTDIVAFEDQLTFEEVLKGINDYGYSRIPVYHETPDSILGILHIKDLLPHVDEPADFNWLPLVRKPHFVPENKQLDDLLKEFKEKRMHFAIVVDEYGGTLGIATMEDLMEEIVGDIQDEFDEDSTAIKKLDANTYVLEAGLLLTDLSRHLDIDPDIFDDIKGDSETVAGILLELSGKVPAIGDKIKYSNFEFIIEQADKRRIKKVKLHIR